MTARRGRSFWIAAASVTLHAALLAVVAAYAPRLMMPDSASGPPEPIIPILIMPRTPPAATGPNAKLTPIRLHRRPQRFVPPEEAVPPLVVPQAPVARPSALATSRPTSLPSSRDEVADNVAKVLRGRLGCANPSSLSRAEREACEDQLAAGARDAAFTGLGLARDKAAELDRTATRKAADVKWRNAPGGGHGVPGSGRSETPGSPNLGLGTSAHDLAAAQGNDRPEAKLPF